VAREVSQCRERRCVVVVVVVSYVPVVISYVPIVVSYVLVSYFYCNYSKCRITQLPQS
jgi:hypothetical protein